MKKKYLLYLLFYFVSSSVFGQGSDLLVTFPTPLPMCKSGDCTNILANFPLLGQTTGYNNGLPIPPQTYSPDFPTTWDGIFGHKIDATGDDVWSPVFNLPFNFTFYGVTYNKLIIGSNGVISFDIANAGGFCPWAYTGTIPSPTFPIRNAIYCVYQDTDIRTTANGGAVTDPTTQNVNFYILDTGANAAPNRVFVANWNDLPQYACASGVGNQTSQLVLHEGTNQIDFNIKKRSCCSGWNSGSGVIGTQNAAGTLASIPAGFNTGCWNSTNISFQSTPTGTAVPHTLKWEKGGVPVGSVNQNPLNVCVTGPTVYTAIVEYTNPNGTTFSIENDITVDLEGPLPVQTPQTVPICTLGLPPYTVNVNQNSYILNGATPSDYDITYFTDFNAADNDLTASSFYIPNPNAFLLTVAPPFQVYARIFDTNTGCYNVRSFNITGAAPGGTFSYAQPNYCNTLLTTAPVIPSGLSSGGTYAADPATTDLIINAATGEVTPNGSVPATYTVRYTLPASGACPAYTTTAPITIVACSCDVTVTSPPACLGQNATVTAVPVNSTVTYNYVWTVPAAYTDPNPGNVATFQTIVPGTYTVYITDPITSCVSATMSTVVSFVTPPNAGFGASKTICETDLTPINLFSLLTGTPQVGGTWTATGTGTGGTLVGNIYTPAVGSTTRTFEYKVTGTSPCVDATSIITIIIQPQPNAGIDGSTSVCDSNSTPINLFSVLGGSPQTGGTWTATGTGTGGTLVGSIYTPAIGATTRTFEYTITGTAPCVTDKSTVTVTIVPKADAGIDASKTVCETDTTPINLFNLLTGTPQTGGTWTATGTGTGGTFTAGTGTYSPAIGATTRTFEYKVTGTTPCGDDISVVTINVLVQPNAGIDGSTIVCDNDATPINLASFLTGSPQTGGTWAATGTGTGGTFVAATGTFTPAVGATTRTFEYTITGTSPCVTDKSTVTVNIVPKADAGIDASKTVCETDTTPINLFNLLTGTPQTGGTWTATGTGTGGTFIAGTGTYSPAVGATTRTFEYKVTGTTPCGDDTSVVTINVLVQPNAGVDGSTIACDNDATPINLASLLTGSPQTGGTWAATGTGTGGTLVGGIYTPAIGATTRTFEYTITGTAPCVTDKSTVTVNIIPKADAGIDASKTVCETDTTPINLFNLLTGTPQTGGTWTATGTGTGGTFTAGTGTYSPAVGATTRTFEYKVIGTTPCGDDISVVTINVLVQPNAGIDGSTIACDNDATPINLASLLTGSPQTGGTWAATGTGTGGTFVAGTGTYSPAVGATTRTFEYTITGTSPCVTDKSTVTVNIIPKADAGIDASKTVCETDTTPINLFNLLTGTPQTGGTWTATGTGTGGTFTAGTGTYSPAVGATTRTFEYKVTGTTPCGDDTSVVTINVLVQPNAGIDGNTTVCDSDSTPINLASFLTGSPQTGGTWAATGTGTGGTLVGGIYTPAIGATTRTFEYKVSGASPCIDDTSIVTVNIIPKADAGIDASKTVCENDTTPINLFNLLTGTPQLGGTWTATGTGTGGTLVGGIYTPAIGATNRTFEYKVTGTPPCLDDTSIVSINILPLPGAFLAGNNQVCLNTLPKPQITFTGFGGTPPYTFTYNINSGFPQTTQSSSTSDIAIIDVDTNIDGTFRYNLLSVTSATTPACSNPQNDFVIVTVLPLPTATIETSATQACLTTTSPQITFKGFNGTAPYTFEYKINGVLNTKTTASGSNTVSIVVPNTAGVYSYELISVSSTTSPSCNHILSGPNRIVTVTIVPLPTLTLNFGSIATPVVCIGNPIAPIVYTIGGSATGATVVGTLPNGISGVFTGPNTFTISGTPTQSSNTPYNFTVETSGGCLPKATLNGSITVNPAATIVLSSGNNNQSVCVQTQAITNMIYTFANGATSAYISSGNLPTGVNGAQVGNTFVISGTPTTFGTFDFVISTTGGCPSTPINGSITVKPKVSLLLTSTLSTTIQPQVCLTGTILPITYIVGDGAISAQATGLPPGVLQNFNPSTGILTISGPVTSLGTYNYTVSTVGGCSIATLGGTITVIPSATIQLSSPVGTDAQSICIFEPMNDIIYYLDNGATSASIILGEIPKGITAVADTATNSFILSGTPTESGTFNFTIRTSGGCLYDEITGSIRVIALPLFALETLGYVCVDVAGTPTTQVDIYTNLNASQYSFVWSDANGVLSPPETNNFLIAKKPGDYSVDATFLATGCVGTASTTIVPSLPPSAATAASPSYFAENQLITVNVTPPGVYEYQVDNGAFQDSNQFYGLTPGTHTIYVQDKFSCGFTTTTIHIVDFPKYFTPNGDGYNDVWNISEIANQPNSRIFIYDRYGKLVKEISPGTSGWDGTFNAVPLPADDYWFKVFYKEDGIEKEFKSHISLKR
jgi:gliding motility-associated-like protein